MVGFPGETEEHFEHLLDFVQTQKLDYVGVFMYSNEAQAHSSRLPNHVPKEVKQERYRRLMEAQYEIVRRKNQQRVGQVMQVIVERILSEEEQEMYFHQMYTNEFEDEEEEDESSSDSNEDDDDTEHVVVVALGRHYGQCPDIDGQVLICLPLSDDDMMEEPKILPGQRYWLEVTGFSEYDLIGIPAEP